MKQTFKNIIVNLISKVVATLLTLYFVPKYINLLGIESYGIIGIYTTLISAAFLLDFGLSNIVTKELSQRIAKKVSKESLTEFLFTLELIYVSIGLFIGLLVYLLAPLIVNFWITKHTVNNEILLNSIRLIALAIAFQWPHSFYSGALFGLKKQILFQGWYIIFSLFKYIGAFVILKFVSTDLSYFLWWNIVCVFILTMMLRILVWKQSKLSNNYIFNISSILSIKRLSIGMLGIGVLIFMVSDFDKMILSKFLLLTDFGYYNLALIIPTGIMVLGTSIKAAVFPSISTDISTENLEKIKFQYHFYSQLINYILIPFTLIIIVFNQDILQIWTGNHFISQKIGPLIVLLSIGSLLNCFTMIEYSYVLVYERTKFLFIINLICAIIALPILYIMVQRIGLIAAGYYWLLFNFSQWLLLKIYFHLKILKGTFFYSILKDISLPIIISIIIILIFKSFLYLWVDGFFEFSLFFTAIISSIYLLLLIIQSKIRQELSVKIYTILKIFKLKNK